MLFCLNTVGRGGALGKGCMNSNSYKGITLSGFIFFSNKLSEDGVQKKMSSLCMELLKLRNMRDTKEKVRPFAQDSNSELLRNKTSDLQYHLKVLVLIVV